MSNTEANQARDLPCNGGNTSSARGLSALHAPAASRRIDFKGLNLTSPELDRDDFKYSDSSGCLQGPFPKTLILNWWRQSYLPIDLKIQPSQHPDENYVGLRGMLAKWFSGEDQWKYLDSSGNVQVQHLSP